MQSVMMAFADMQLVMMKTCWLKVLVFCTGRAVQFAITLMHSISFLQFISFKLLFNNILFSIRFMESYGILQHIKDEYLVNDDEFCRYTARTEGR